MFDDSSVHHNAQHLKVGIMTGCTIFLEPWNLCTIVNGLTAKPGATVSCSSAGMSADEYQHPSLPFTQAMLLGNGGRLRLQGYEEKALYLGHQMS